MSQSDKTQLAKHAQGRNKQCVWMTPKVSRAQEIGNVQMGQDMPILDFLSDPAVRRVLNSDPNFERLRYLIILAASTEPPFETSGTTIEDRLTFNVKQLWRVARHLGLDFERFRGAGKAFKYLERSGLVRSIRNEESKYHIQYYPTELGISQTILNLDRLRKIQDFQSQAKTMQMTIKKQLASLPPTIFEVSLAKKPFTIGRDKANDLSVDDRYMSSKHACVNYESGKWLFQDLNSRNGSWKVEPEHLKRVIYAELSDNDLYQLGSTVIRFRQNPNA
jgi:hypothetical protein